MTPNLIGLIGRAGAGKDTLAAALTPLGYERVAFADALKRAALASDPYIDTGSDFRRLSELVDSYGWDGCKRAFPDVRRYLQRYGVAMRDELPGCWVGIAARRIDQAITAGRGVVVTDVRFPDEADMIRQADGVIVRVVRPRVYNLGAELAAHVSESNVDKLAATLMVNNRGDLDELAGRARELHEILTEAAGWSA